MSTGHDIDPLNFSVTRLSLFIDCTHLSYATGFFYRAVIDFKENWFLITNWHVLSGRSTEPPHRTLNKQGAVPNMLKARLVLPATASAEQKSYSLQDVTISLFSDSGDAVWIQHPLGPFVDVAALNLGNQLTDYRVEDIVSHASDYDMAIEIGNEVFILGYPLGFTHFLDTPIWKRGSIASEPHQEIEGRPPRIVIDATTRGGMSGAPVIMRAKTHYVTESREVVAKPNATRLIGVYASRPGVDETQAGLQVERSERSELGFVYKSGTLPEMLSHRVPGPNYGLLP